MSAEKFIKKLIVVTLFSIAMGYLETVVVVYLREIYYPQGFRFPLIILPQQTLRIEYLRELATLVMLGAVGWLAGKTFSTRFGWFLFSFGVWDIFYYVFLKVLLGWPVSLLTWDILFLIPVVWVAPVLAPVISACTMILYGVVLNLPRYAGKARLSLTTWMLLLGGALLVFITFIRDYTHLIWQYIAHRAERGWTEQDLFTAITSYVPELFAWVPFLAGEILILASLVVWTKGSSKKKKVKKSKSPKGRKANATMN
jgi:phosphoglycerol transferase MdoB-like AlkP superfamily enzyme